MPRETEDYKEGFICGLKAIGYTDEDATNEYEHHLATTVTKDVILGVTSDLVANFMFYDRKEDECLPRGAIEDAIEHGHITVDEIVAVFRKGLEDKQ